MSVAILAACGFFFSFSAIAAVVCARQLRGVVYALLAVAFAVFGVLVVGLRIVAEVAP